MNDKDYAYIDLAYLEMMSDGDVDMKQVMLDMLLEELPQEMEKMSNLLTQADWNELGSVSHKMKSTLAFVGNEQMTNANKDIELLAKSQENVAEIESLMTVLTTLCPKVLGELQTEKTRL
ncbi:MAG: Hpt domain-containing protein [Bacteroidota bacterium]